MYVALIFVKNVYDFEFRHKHMLAREGAPKITVTIPRYIGDIEDGQAPQKTASLIFDDPFEIALHTQKHGDYGNELIGKSSDTSETSLNESNVNNVL